MNAIVSTLRITSLLLLQLLCTQQLIAQESVAPVSGEELVKQNEA